MTDRAPDDLRSTDVSAIVERGVELWADAELAAALFAIDPRGFGGVAVQCGAGPVRDRWLRQLGALLPEDMPTSTLPATADITRVCGGIDLAASLSQSRPVLEEGLLAATDGGVLTVRMADRLNRETAAILATALDTGTVAVERDGLSARHSAAIALVLLDEGGADERLSEVLTDRIAFSLPIDAVPLGCSDDFSWLPVDIESARRRYTEIAPSDGVRAVIDNVCRESGILSLRKLLFAIRAACAHAALRGSREIDKEDIVAACRLVLGARIEPAPEELADPNENDDAQSEKQPEQHDSEERPELDEPDELSEVSEQIVDAVRHAAVTLASLELRTSRQRAASRSGRAGDASRSRTAGRPIGSRPGDPRRGGKLDVLGTLRAAVPWQKLRPPPPSGARVSVYPSDFRTKMYVHKSASTVIFAVDASGSSALHRLAEAKGAVENLLGECYSRRDLVSLIVFKGAEAELLLPPSRSLVRARRALASSPGGGGTPLADALNTAWDLAVRERREGRTPIIVVLSDGKANVSLAGDPGRARAREQAIGVAQLIGADQIRGLFFDTSPRPSEAASSLAQHMKAAYTPLPYADAKAVADAVREEQSGLRS